MLNIALIDNELEVLLKTKRMIENMYMDSKVRIYQDYKKLFMDIEKDDYEIDLLIVDISVGENGIESSKRLLKYKPNLGIVFTSESLRLYEDIFQVQPIYFLKKPLTKERVKKALDKAKLVMEKRKHVFSFESNGILMKYESYEIYYIESQGRKLFFHGKRKYRPIYMKLSDLEERVPDNFVRIHQSYMINIDYLKTFSQKEVVLHTGERIPISQKRYKEAKIKIFDYAKEENVLG
jgi:DNA-binding LytR/AlgR family response regulator